MFTDIKFHHTDMHTKTHIDTPIFIYAQRLTLIKEPQITYIYTYILANIHIYTNKEKNTHIFMYICMLTSTWTHIPTQYTHKTHMHINTILSNLRIDQIPAL